MRPLTTIFALATGAPPSAIAIVRISGPAAFDTLQRLTRGAIPPARQLVRRALRDPADGDIIDHALVAVFPGPESATGDDLVELHLHGGTAVVAAVLAVLDRCGLETAGPGAFTRRAFDNGKLDLGQVEALGDLLTAETAEQRRSALARSGTGLAERVDRWRGLLASARAEIEATLDFSDEEGVPTILSAAMQVGLSGLCRELGDVRAEGDRGARLRSGVTVAIVGPVNAGKSTLFNALARRDAAMVSPQPGTTRDLIEARLELGGVLAVLVDTAGLREADDPLEKEGIRRGIARADTAEIVIALGATDRRDAICVAAKIDLGTDAAGWRDGVLHLSAVRGDGMNLLEAELISRLHTLTGGREPALVAHRWQMAALDDAGAALCRALGTQDAIILAEELRQATSALERLIGRVTTDQLLDGIFSRFCVGK